MTTEPSTTLFTTDRLLVRPIDLDRDLDALHDMYSDPDVVVHIGGRLDASPEETRERMEQRTSGHAPGLGFFAAELKENGEVVGIAAVRELDGGPEIEFGYHLRRRFWRQGLATEVGAGCIAYARDVLGLSEIWGIVAPANARSIAVQEKLGLVYQRTAIVYGLEHRLFRRTLTPGETS